jgi:hypothetical protein
MDHQVLRNGDAQLKFVSSVVQLPPITVFLLGQFTFTAAHYGRF